MCDDFYEVESGGQIQRVGDREVRVAFEDPLARGFESRETAIDAATDHLCTQFARLGVDSEAVAVDIHESTDGT